MKFRGAISIDEFIAGAADAEDVLRTGGVLFDLFSDVGDMEALKENVKISKGLGFEGMGCIHPRQIKVIHESFAPEEVEIDKAKKIVNAFIDATERGLGVVSLGTTIRAEMSVPE